RRALQDVLEDALQERLGDGHVVVEVEKGHLRLHHPELREVPGGVGVFGAEGGTERVDLSKRASKDFGLELTADGKESGTFEEVQMIVDLGVLSGRIGQVECGYLEHLAGALAVAGRDDGRMDIQKPLFLEKVMNGAADAVADPGHGAKGVGARAQVC